MEETMHYQIIVNYTSTDSENSEDAADSIPMEFPTMELAVAAVRDLEQHVAFSEYLVDLSWEKAKKQMERLKAKSYVFPWVTENGYDKFWLKLNNGDTREKVQVFWHCSMDRYQSCDIVEVKEEPPTRHNSSAYFDTILGDPNA